MVGLPLISLLLRENASVNVYHSKTVNLKEKTSLADIVIVASGCPLLIKEDFVKEDAVVIDVGINRVDGKLCGDCDFLSLYDKVSYITPVPGGVGPMTIAMLMHNVIKAAKGKIGIIDSIIIKTHPSNGPHTPNIFINSSIKLLISLKNPVIIIRLLL